MKYFLIQSNKYLLNQANKESRNQECLKWECGMPFYNNPVVLLLMTLGMINSSLALSVTQYKKERDGKRRIAFFHPSPYFYVCRAKA